MSLMAHLPFWPEWAYGEDGRRCCLESRFSRAGSVGLADAEADEDQKAIL